MAEREVVVDILRSLHVEKEKLKHLPSVWLLETLAMATE